MKIIENRNRKFKQMAPQRTKKFFVNTKACGTEAVNVDYGKIGSNTDFLVTQYVRLFLNISLPSAYMNVDDELLSNKLPTSFCVENHRNIFD